MSTTLSTRPLKLTADKTRRRADASARTDPAMRGRRAPRRPSLRDAATSSWLPLRALLVVRVLAAALLVAHTVLFSATRHFDYAQPASFANALLTVALLAATFCSLAHLIADPPPFVVGPAPTDSPTSVEISIFEDEELSDCGAAEEQPALAPHYDPPLLRTLAMLSVPLLQVAGSAVLVAAAIAWMTRRVFKVNADVPTMYVAFVLHAGNPALYVLDFVLAAQLRRRLCFAVVPLVWAVFALYAVCVRFAARRLDVLPTGRRDIVVSAVLTAVIPIALVALSWLPPACSRIYRSAAPVPALALKKNNSPASEPKTPIYASSEGADHVDDRYSDSSSAPSPREPFPRLLAPADRIPHRSSPRIHVPSRSLPASPPDRMRLTRPLSGLLAATRHSGASLGSSAQGSTSMHASMSASSLNSETRLRRLVRVTSSGSESSAWSGVADVAVEIDPELFRMPGESDITAIPIPSRFKSVLSTSLV